MTKEVDIVVRNARLRDRPGELTDIAIADGVFAKIGKLSDCNGQVEIDAGGNLVTPSYVNPHLHLCKVWTLPMMSEAALNAYQGDGMKHASSAIELASKVKESYHASWIVKNARRAVALAALHGTLHIRAFADVDSRRSSRASGRCSRSAMSSAASSICRWWRSRKTASSAIPERIG